MSRLIKAVLSLVLALLFLPVLAKNSYANCGGGSGDGCSAGNYCIGDYATINTYSCTTPADPDDHCIEALSGTVQEPCTDGTCGSWESFSIHGCTTWEIPDDGSCDDDTSWRGGSCCSECDADPSASPDPGCEDTSPDQPVLSSPADGSTIDDKTVTLSWNGIADWGEACDGNTNTYQVCIDTVSGGCTWGAAGLADTILSYQFIGTSNATYYWRVIANNGAVTNPSVEWNFDLIVRPALCDSTAVEFLSGNGGKNSAKITSTAINDTITDFSLAFYNLDNLSGGDPLAYCVDGGSSSSCPAGSSQYTVGYTVVSGTEQSHEFTIDFDDLSGPDRNWDDQAPQKLQINGYFVDDKDRVSLGDPNCVEEISKVEGRVYLYDGIGACDTAEDLNYQSVISNCGGSASTVINDGPDFHLLACGSSTVLSVAVSDPTYGCSFSCNDGLCNFRTVLTGNGENQDFYYQLMKPAWWQVDSGNVHADGGDVSSNIPSTCSGSCKPYLITGISGLASYTGTWDTGEGTINETGDEWRAQTNYQGFETNYGYFERILADDPVDSEPWDGSQPDEDKVYTYTDSISTSGIWTIPNDQKSVILVDDDVTITDNITVAEGGFLAIIASGKIIIDSGVTELQGVYIANGVIETGVSTTQLQAEGIFTGWGGFNLQRDLGIGNDDDPAEKFIYRPDLVRNAYRYLLKPKIGWAEVAP